MFYTKGELWRVSLNTGGKNEGINVAFALMSRSLLPPFHGKGGKYFTFSGNFLSETYKIVEILNYSSNSFVLAFSSFFKKILWRQGIK